MSTIATFVRVHGGRLAQFSVAGVGKVYVTTASFPDKVVPSELDVTAFPLREPSEAAVAPGDEAKAAAAAAKAQEKALKAEARAQAAREKAEARVKKAQEAAAKAAERAAALTAKHGTPATPEGGEQPEL